MAKWGTDPITIHVPKEHEPWMEVKAKAFLGHYVHTSMDDIHDTKSSGWGNCRIEDVSSLIKWSETGVGISGHACVTCVPGTNYKSDLLPQQGQISMELAKRTQATIRMTSQLASFVPNYVLNNEFTTITYDTSLDVVALICHVSGFTALNQAYSLRGKGGTELLRKTLSHFMNPLVECILRAGADIIKYAGYDFLAIWTVSNGQFRRELMRVVNCALHIQESGYMYCADVDMTIRVKLGIGAGVAHECVIGNQEYHHYVTFGPAVEDASNSEQHCEKGDVIISPAAWSCCVPADFTYTMREGQFIKITKILSYPSGEPTDDKGRGQKHVKDIRPIDRKGVDQLRPYVVPAVHKILGANIPLDYLNEFRPTSICFIKVELKPFDDTSSFVNTMVGYIQKAFRIIYNTCKLTGGWLIKILTFDKGMTYLVAFGLPGSLYSNKSANALEFSHRVKGEILEIKGVTQVSVGVTTGTSYCGILGHPKRQEYTVLGQIVNKAERLMCSYPGSVSCDEDTVFHSQLPIHQFSILPQKVLKGISAAGNICEYLGVETGQDQTVKTFEYPIVNRDTELKFFKRVLGNYQQGFARFVKLHQPPQLNLNWHLITVEELAHETWMLIIEGDVGVGKSRLLSAFIQEADEIKEIVIFSLTMTAILKEPLEAIRVLLYQAFELEDLATMQEKEQHLRKAASHDPDLLSSLGLLNELLHLRFPISINYRSTEFRQREEKAQVICGQLLNKIWPESFLLFVVDDAHLMDPHSWEYLYYLSRSPHVLVVVTILRTPSGTPKLDPSVAKIVQNVQTIPLKRMDVAHCASLACQMLEVFTIPQELEKILIQKSNGNPAFINQILSEMLRTGLLLIVPYDLKKVIGRKMKLTCVDLKLIRRLEIEPNKLSWLSEPSSVTVSPSTESTDSIASSTRSVDRQKAIEHPEMRMCVVKSETNLGAMPIPRTGQEILIATFDELNSNEQMLLKVASIIRIGSGFGRRMLIFLVPEYEVNFHKYRNGLKHLMEGNIIRCASVSPDRHPGQDNESGKGSVNCFCRLTEDKLEPSWMNGSEVCIGNTKTAQQYPNCKFMEFAKESMAQVIYELMTEEQRKNLHLKAARYFDTSIPRCGIHGGEDTAYKFGFVIKERPDLGEGLRQAAGGIRRSSFYDTTQAIRVDSSRKIYGATTASNFTKLEFNIVQEIDKLYEKRKVKMLDSCWRRNGTLKLYERESQFEIKKFVLQGSGSEEHINELGSTHQADCAPQAVIDLRRCTCPNIQAKVCIAKVTHYRQAEKYGKCLVNLLDASECEVTIGNCGQAMIHLEAAEELVQGFQNNVFKPASITDFDDVVFEEEVVAIRVNFLNGFTSFALGRHLEAREYFLKSLEILGMEIPKAEDKVKMGRKTLGLNAKLWQRHTFGRHSRTYFQKIVLDRSLTLKLRLLTFLQVLYQVERKYDMALLLALWQVLIAEKESGSYQDILPAYCTVMETCSLMNYHKRARIYEKLSLKLIRQAFENSQNDTVTPLGLYTTASFFSSLASLRFLRGEITSAADSGYLGLRIVRGLHDNALAIQLYPTIVISLLAALRIPEVVEVLQKLWYTSEEAQDWNGTSLYWTLTLNLLLYTAYPLEPYSACEHFVTERDWESDQIFGMYELQYNIESSIALWNARFGRWDMSEKWIEKAVKSKSMQVNYFTVEGQLKLLECELMFVNHCLEGKRFQHFTKSRNTVELLMCTLEVNTQRIPVLQPRFLHLMAYYCRIRGRTKEAGKYMRKALNLANAQGNSLEVDWITHNRTVWKDTGIPAVKSGWKEHVETVNGHQSSSVHWSNIMFSLPIQNPQ